MGVNSRSIYFNPPDGQHSYIKLGTSSGLPSIKNLANFTWMAWVKPDVERVTSLAQRLYVERQGSAAANRIRFSAFAGKDRVRFELTVKDGDNDTNYDFLYDWDQRWHHIAFVGKVTGTTPTYEIYFDTTKVASGTLRKASGMDEISNTMPLANTCYLGNASYHGTGAESFKTGNQWYGKVDDILVFKEALGQGDIQDYVASRDTWALGDPDLISYWGFDETAGTSTTDLDNPTWSGELRLNGVASATLRTTDRPYMGNGVLDTTPPSQPSSASTVGVTTDGFIMSVSLPSDQSQSGQSGINVQNIEFQVDTSSAMTSYTTYTVPVAFSTASSLMLAINDLLPNETYYWRARAIDEALNASDDWDSPQMVTTLSTQVTPTPPAGIQVQNATYSTLDLIITPNAFDVDGGAMTIGGFKVDVAHDNRFRTYVEGWQNADIGYDTSVTIDDLDELSSYFFRVRQYSTTGTESVSSGIVIGMTTSAPDDIPPLPVDMNITTSIDAREATLHWETGKDNVGVVHYLLDIATDAGFASLVMSDINVGDVTDYRITGLTPGTEYYAKVNAVDAAGNVSLDGQYTTFTTASVGLEDGGTITVEFSPTADLFTNSGSTGTNYGTVGHMEIQGNGSAATKYGWLQFDLSDLESTFIAANLYLRILDSTTGTPSIRVSNSITIDESTTTWANQPAIATTATTFSASSGSTWSVVDLTPYITTPGIYVVRIEMTSSDLLNIATKEGYLTNPDFYAPYLEVEYDPAPQLKPDTLQVEDGVKVYENLSVRPNAINGVTTGWTATANNTLSAQVLIGRWGGNAFRNIMNSAVTNPIGMQTTTPVTVETGDVLFVSCYVKATTDAVVKITCEGLNAANALVATNTVTGFAPTGGFVPVHGYFSTAEYPTVDKVRVTIGGTQSQATTLYVDSIVITRLSIEDHPGLLFGVGAYYDGTVGGVNGFWNGTANGSTSTRYGASLSILATYLGDSNGNSTAVPMFKRASESVWISPHQQVTMYADAGLNQLRIHLGPTFGYYNQLNNPSFEVNTNGYGTVGGGVVLSRTEDDSVAGIACGKVVTTANADVGIKTQKVYVGPLTDTHIHARASIKVPTSHTVYGVIKAYNAANTLIGTGPIVTGLNKLTGNDNWQEIETSYELPALTYSYEFHILQETASIGTWYVDALLVGDGEYVNPYRDGTYEDAYFEGTIHDSATSLFILPDELYDVRVLFHDDDGIIDQSGTEADITTTFRTGEPPDYRTVINEASYPLEVSATSDTINFRLKYFGDDDHEPADDTKQLKVVIEYKRSDQFTWKLVNPLVDRVNKYIIGTIPNLIPGTLYDVRITLTDTDGVSGLSGGIKQFQQATSYFGENALTPSTITFGGFLLHDETQKDTLKTFVLSHNAFGFPDRRLDIQEIPRSDGAVELSATWGTRTINMRGIVYGDTRNEVMDAIDQMKIGLMGRQKPLIINTFSNTNRRYYATCRSVDIEEVGGVNFRHLTWEAIFECADPFAYSANTITFGPTTVELDGTTVTYNNLGGLETYPVITISTRSSSRITPRILNTLTNQVIVPGVGMITDDILVIDSAAKSVKLNNVDINYTGIFPTLQPGDNEWVFEAERGPSSARIYVTVQWVERFL